MITNFATAVTTQKELELVIENLQPLEKNLDWLTQYRDPECVQKLPTWIAYQVNGNRFHDCGHQPYTSESEKQKYYDRYYTNYPLVPIEAFTNPRDYPEHYL